MCWKKRVLTEQKWKIKELMDHENGKLLRKDTTKPSIHTGCHNLHDTIRHDGLYLRAPKSWRIASLLCRTEPNKKRTVMKKLKTKDGDAQKKPSSNKVHGVSETNWRYFTATEATKLYTALNNAVLTKSKLLRYSLNFFRNLMTLVTYRTIQHRPLSVLARTSKEITTWQLYIIALA